MIQLTKGQTSENITVTLNEKRTLDTGYYLFVFTHYTTKEVKTVIFAFSDDLSSYTDRFNQFEINTSVVFANDSPGTWEYDIYEQASAVNTDPTGLTNVEKGILELLPSTEFEFVENTATTSFKHYNG